MAKKKKKTFRFAYDAWWFLHYHPAFRVRERNYVEDPKSDYYKNQQEMIHEVAGHYYRETKHLHRHAVECNLDIHYSRVDETGTINDDESKNRYTEVWLEFGPIEWSADYYQKLNQELDEDPEAHTWRHPITEYMVTHLTHSHDYRLDCGAPTFDEALVQLANLVLKHYGDYKDDENERKTCGGKEVCADCRYYAGLKLLRLKGGSYEFKHEEDMTEEERARAEEL